MKTASPRSLALLASALLASAAQGAISLEVTGGTGRVVAVQQALFNLANLDLYLGRYARDVLVSRGVEVRLKTRLTEITATRAIVAVQSSTLMLMWETSSTAVQPPSSVGLMRWRSRSMEIR